MAKKVSMATQRLDVARVGTAPEFSVSDDDRVVGDLRISVGGAYWRPRNAQNYLHLPWEKVDELFRAHGQPKAVGEYKFAPAPPNAYEEPEPGAPAA